MEIRLIENDRYSKNLENGTADFIIRISLIVIILGGGYFLRMFDLIISLKLLILGAVCYLIVKYTRRLFPDWVSKTDEIGFLKFNKESVSINDSELLLLKDFDKVLLLYNMYQGFQRGKYDPISNGMAQIKIYFRNNRTQTLSFIIRNSDQFEFLRSCIKQWYKSGIEVTELRGDGKVQTFTFYARGELYYKEFNELKKELLIIDNNT
jgi:hypothetical protein